MVIGTGVHAQSKATVSGYLRDAATGEELIGVTVYVPSIKSGTVTNVYGFYSITVSSGNYDFHYSYIGYKDVVKNIALLQDTELNISMVEEAESLEEVIITGEVIDGNVMDISMSRDKIDMVQMKSMPALFGEPDLIKMVQMMPGVATAGEGTSAYFVRGGSADQNMILIDEAPIYDPSHLFGYISVFNADVIKSSELYKGGIPSRYGGKLSSILDVRTKDGNNKKISGSAGIGTLASKLMLEGPIKKEKGSYLISARRSYADVLLKAAGNDNSVYFYDVNAKVSWKGNNKNRFFLAGYFGRDAFSIGGTFGFDWGNRTASFRWNHLFSDKLFSNTTLIASTFDYGLILDDESLGFEWTSAIKEYSFKQDFNWYINPNNSIEFGYHFTYKDFAPGKIEPLVASSLFVSSALQSMYAFDHALYAANTHTINENLSFEYGLRLSVFQNIGSTILNIYKDPHDNINPTIIDQVEYEKFENIKTFINLEPRFGGRYVINSSSSIKVSYNRMVQNTHLISSGTVPLPFNTWSPSTPYLNPQLSDQIVGGFFKNFKNNEYEVSTETFYKHMTDVTDFADNAVIFFNEDLATEFRQGNSWAYGAELQVKKNEGRFTGFMNYTWSKTERKIPGVNLGSVFLANHDRRNTFNVMGSYELSDKWRFSSTFTYQTGRPITLAAGRYEYGEYQPSYISERNGYKLPDYHRMDFSTVWIPKKNKDRKWKTEWVFGVYNAYNRKNAFTIYSRDVVVEDVRQDTKEYVRVHIFPVLPSVTFNLKF